MKLHHLGSYVTQTQTLDSNSDSSQNAEAPKQTANIVSWRGNYCHVSQVQFYFPLHPPKNRWLEITDEHSQ